MCSAVTKASDQCLSAIARTLTGIPGLDEILGGGIPAGRVVLLVGGPGAGKTILATQFLVNGVRNYGENSAFVSMDESKQHYFSEMEKFGWDLGKLEHERKFAFVDASPIRTIPGEVKIGKMTIGKKDFSLLSLIEGIKGGVKAIGAKRIVIDPIASLVFQFPDIVPRRNAVLDLIEALAPRLVRLLGQRPNAPQLLGLLGNVDLILPRLFTGR